MTAVNGEMTVAREVSAQKILVFHHLPFSDDLISTTKRENYNKTNHSNRGILGRDTT
jgi:hypothetical protein